MQAIGKLAELPHKPGSTVSGLLVSKDYSYTLLHPNDLPDFAGLSTSTVTQKQRIAIGCGFELVKWHLQGMFGSVSDEDVDDIRTLKVCACNISLKNVLMLGLRRLWALWRYNKRRSLRFAYSGTRALAAT